MPDLSRAGRERCRPQPQLRRVLGRARRERRPAEADLPRPGAVLRARVAQRPVARLPPPRGDADHQPHVHGPRPAPAGLAEIGPPIDEPRGYKELGDAMAAQRLLQPAGSTSTTRPARPRTGATATGGSATRSRSTAARPTTRRAAARAAFHPRYEEVREWEGGERAGRPVGGHGNREAYYLAAESTLDEARHSVIEGTAPAGTTLKLTKAFKTAAFEPFGDGRRPARVDPGRRALRHVPLAREPVHPADRDQSWRETESYTLTCGETHAAGRRSSAVRRSLSTRARPRRCPPPPPPPAPAPPPPRRRAPPRRRRARPLRALRVFAGRTLRIDASGPVSILQQSSGHQIPGRAGRGQAQQGLRVGQARPGRLLRRPRWGAPGRGPPGGLTLHPCRRLRPRPGLRALCLPVFGGTTGRDAEDQRARHRAARPEGHQAGRDHAVAASASRVVSTRVRIGAVELFSRRL